MFSEFGPAPLCLELDLDSYDGPWQHVWRFRNRSGWLLVAKATIQSADDLMTRKLVVACDEYEVPIPGFQAVNLTKCTWRRPSECMEFPPAILDDLLCEEEGALIAQWHREQNSALLRNYDERMQRIEALEGKVTAFVRANDRRIAELRRRRRLASGEEGATAALTAVIDDLERENEQLIAELGQTRADIRRSLEEEEERLWRRADLLVEVEPIHLIRWEGSPATSSEIEASGLRTTFVPANPRRSSAQDDLGLSGPKSAEWLQNLQQVASAIPEPTPRETKKAIAGLVDVQPAGVNGIWTPKRIELLRQYWSEGLSASEIARRLGLGEGRVVGKAYRIGLPKRLKSPGGAQGAEPCQNLGSKKALAEQQADESSWSPEREALLRRLWTKGLSAQMIARLIGNCSRNAVLGKAKRLGLPMSKHAETTAAQ